ncbi:MAG: hypothetical protein JO363_11915 [Solirubrobacterales bacterium]|nr:hypothetical protein [Solirubrobacterales bacterium]
MSAVGKPALLGGNVSSSALLLSLRMVVSESRALLERIGRARKSRRQELGNLPATVGRALGVALARRRLAFVRGQLSSIQCLLAQLLLVAPALAVALRPVPLRGLVTLLSQKLAPVRGVFAVVGASLALIGDPLTLIGDPVAFIGDPIAFIRGPLTLIGHPFVLIGRPLASIRSRQGARRVSLLLALSAQRVALVLERCIIGLDLRHLVDVHAAAFGLGSRRLVALVVRAGA